ncbi:MAG: argininosuccinate lyase, partial [Bacteroidota bacterium]
TARSRNDQVLVDMHLFLKDEIKEIAELIKNLFDRLINLGERHKDVIIPGYTHFQVAMPSSFGLWFGAYAESLIDDVHFLQAAYKIADQNPLGSAAGYGSSFPINRTLTTELMEFSTLKYNSVAAQMSRGKLEKSVSMGLASVAGTLSRMAMDICLYMSQNFGFLTFPDELTTGSSIMPHKKNPDVFELVRGKCNKIQALPTELMLITNNLPSGYHREMQLLKENLFPALESLKSCLEINDYMLDNVIIKKSAVDHEMYDYIYSVEAVNELVVKGMSFRDAYKEVGKEINSGNFIPNREVNHTHEGSIGNLCSEDIVAKMGKAIRSLTK